ncbi:MAG: type IV toxin-antitoxin system AbiEi family antitoxin domain-containing protein [Planctomycetes bacterium]|nr:type IV toxin-antitoxin system AbiEi family antitoxin domain-containing protein [Planctomycetota bacterium]
MNVIHPISDKILRRLHARRGQSVPASDFSDLGSPLAIRKALSRLVRQGAIRRVRRGLYELPRMGKLLNQPVVASPDELVHAWARKNGLRVVPSGAYAANLLGLSTQVPAKLVYYTNGRTRTLKLGPYTVQLLNRGPKTMDVRGQVAPLVLQALRYLGSNGVTPEVIGRLRSVLSPKDKTELCCSLHHAAAWMKPVIEEVAGEERR